MSQAGFSHAQEPPPFRGAFSLYAGVGVPHNGKVRIMSYEKELTEKVKQDTKHEMKNSIELEAKRSWPLWVLYGLLSVLGVFILSIPALIGVDSPLLWGFMCIPFFISGGWFLDNWAIIGIAIYSIFWFMVGGFCGLVQFKQ